MYHPSNALGPNEPLVYGGLRLLLSFLVDQMGLCWSHVGLPIRGKPIVGDGLLRYVSYWVYPVIVLLFYTIILMETLRRKCIGQIWCGFWRFELLFQHHSHGGRTGLRIAPQFYHYSGKFLLRLLQHCQWYCRLVWIPFLIDIQRFIWKTQLLFLLLHL